VLEFRRARRSAAARKQGVSRGETWSGRYDAFISYSHAVDGKLAPRLHAGLHAFAKPWYRLRALRVFRDETSLSASPGLWPSIVAALDQSGWLILLAAPEAAASPWVRRELEHWCGRGRRDRLLIVLTAGDIAIDRATGRVDWAATSALPSELSEFVTDAPDYVDLRWARTADDVSLANARFRDAVADVAATVHERPKDELLGEDVRQHRRTRRLARAVAAVLVVLTAAATVAAIVALEQREQAVAERDRAEE
jgi:hypothetical protein